MLYSKPLHTMIFVAEKESILVGYIYGRILLRSDRVLDRIGFIEDWFVLKKNRKQSVGKLLWTKLISWFKKKKCNGLELNSFTRNKKALSLYNQMGFVEKFVTLMKKIK